MVVIKSLGLFDFPTALEPFSVSALTPSFLSRLLALNECPSGEVGFFLLNLLLDRVDLGLLGFELCLEFLIFGL